MRGLLDGSEPFDASSDDPVKSFPTSAPKSGRREIGSSRWAARLAGEYRVQISVSVSDVDASGGMRPWPETSVVVTTRFRALDRRTVWKPRYMGNTRGWGETRVNATPQV